VRQACLAMCQFTTRIGADTAVTNALAESQAKIFRLEKENKRLKTQHDVVDASIACIFLERYILESRLLPVPSDVPQRARRGGLEEEGRSSFASLVRYGGDRNGSPDSGSGEPEPGGERWSVILSPQPLCDHKPLGYGESLRRLWSPYDHLSIASVL